MSQAAGASARAIRLAAGATLAEVAEAAKKTGLPWSSGRVGDFESGRIAPSLPTLIAVAGALSRVTQAKAVGLPDLFAVDGKIRINDVLTLDSHRLRDLLRGGDFQVLVKDLTEQDVWQQKLDDARKEFYRRLRAIPDELRPPIPQIADVRKAFVEGDERFLRSLGVDKFTGAAAMASAWGKTFVQQRDDLAGPNANAQRKGIVARQLKSELRTVLDGYSQ